jgi:hypothetical protein
MKNTAIIIVCVITATLIAYPLSYVILRKIDIITSYADGSGENRVYCSRYLATAKIMQYIYYPLEIFEITYYSDSDSHYEPGWCVVNGIRVY